MTHLRKENATKPDIAELRHIEAQFDPLKETESPRVEWLVGRMERPRHGGVEG